ncbi:hypothetical protein EDD40_4128 [Saccharothrix texasensis]|uniref:Uncharacterized protein n=1 Tax=Saccharothrix texasensis TaxID=103734 RepID=A0A3N1H892_9PSEU|nr:hypothetical protein EDD40_4128 [Saccharothrix texasensis]
MGKKWLVAVAGLVGAAGLVVVSRRSARAEEPARPVAVRRREAPRREDVRRGGGRQVGGRQVGGRPVEGGKRRVGVRKVGAAARR